MVIDALPAVSYKCSQLSRLYAFSGRSDNDNHATWRQWYECLASQRVPLDHIHTQRQGCWRAATGYAYRDITIAKVNVTKVIETFEASLIHRIGLVERCLDDVSIRREPLACEGFGP